MVNYSIRSIPEALKYFQEMTQDGLSELGYETPVLKPRNSGSQVIYEKSHAVSNYLTISTDLRGERKIIADKALIKDFMKALNDPDKPLHYTIKNMLNVKYIDDIAHLDRDLTKRYDCIVCCFDDSESLFVIYSQIPRGLYEIRPVKQVMKNTINDVKGRIGWKDTEHTVSVAFPERFSDSNIFAFFVLICIVFDVNESARDLNNLKSIPLNDEILLNVLSATQTNSPILPVVLEVLPVHNPIVGKTYLYETRKAVGSSFKLPVRYWFDKKGGSRPMILPLVIDFNNPYWSKCTWTGRIEDFHDHGDVHFMCYNLHKFRTGPADREEEAFYLESDWSPYDLKHSSTLPGATTTDFVRSPDYGYGYDSLPRPGPAAGSVPSQGPGRGPGPAAGSVPGPGPGSVPSRGPGRSPGPVSGSVPSRGPGRDPGPVSGSVPSRGPAARPTHDSVPGPDGFGSLPRPGPAAGSVPGPAPGSVPRRGSGLPGPAPDPTHDSVPGPDTSAADFAGGSSYRAHDNSIRRFLNAYYQYVPYRPASGGVYCGKWHRVDNGVNYDEGDKIAKIVTAIHRPEHFVEEFVWRVSGTGKVLDKVRDPVLEPEALPKIYSPTNGPTPGEGGLICRGILFEVDGDKWKMQLSPSSVVPGYFCVETPLGARFYKESEYNI